MTTMSPRPLLSTFIPSLNALLIALNLPFSLDHPTDLTPSLLLAIFESLINARLPIPISVRQSRTRDAKARAMLVLLGVLECDVLRGGTASVDSNAEHSIATSNADDSALVGAGGVSVDGWVDEIGLGQVDPERLADGGWEETIFVGELLCWLARRKGVLPRTRSSRKSSRSRSLYLSHHSFGTEGDGELETTADFSTSLLLRPSPTQKNRSPRSPSPFPSSTHDVTADADASTLSHITDIPRHPLVHSPEPSLSVSATTGTDLSIRARTMSSRTSINTHDDLDQFEEASQDTMQIYNSARMMQDAEEDDDLPPSFRPRCIHDLEDPSYIQALAGPSSYSSDQPVSDDEDNNTYEPDNDDLYAPPTPTPRRVRLAGWIDPVDPVTELSHFSRSRVSHTSVGSGPHFQPQSKPASSHFVPPRAQPGVLRPRTPRYPSPSPSPSPSPPLLATSSKCLPRGSSPTTHSDPPIDISFSAPDNTSTPAKPRPPRRPQFQTLTHYDMDTEVRDGAYVGISRGDTGKGKLPHRDRSPSYTPSPPSFSTPRLASGSKSRVGASASATTATRMASGSQKRNGSPLTSPPTMPLLARINSNGRSSPYVPPPGSPATTNTLLTERARLLTELAAFKRARAASGGGGGSDGINPRPGTGNGARMGANAASGSVVGHRAMGVGV